MGKLTVNLPDELKTSIRQKISKKGYKKGDISKELTRILKKWLQENGT